MQATNTTEPTLQGADATAKTADRLHLCCPAAFEALVLHHLAKAERWYDASASIIDKPPHEVDRESSIVQRAAFSFLATHGFQLWPTQVSSRQHLKLDDPLPYWKCDPHHVTPGRIFFSKEGQMSGYGDTMFKKRHARLPDVREKCLASHIAKFIFPYVLRLVKKGVVSVEKDDVEVDTLLAAILQARATAVETIPSGQNSERRDSVVADSADNKTGTRTSSSASTGNAADTGADVSDLDMNDQDPFEDELKRAVDSIDSELQFLEANKKDVPSSVAPVNSAGVAVNNAGSLSTLPSTELPQTCARCRKVFPTNKKLGVHMRKIHSGLRLPWPCHLPDCWSSYDTEEDLKRHLMNDHTYTCMHVRWEQCPICDASFSHVQTKQLQTHLGDAHGVHIEFLGEKIVYKDAEGNVVAKGEADEDQMAASTMIVTGATDNTRGMTDSRGRPVTKKASGAASARGPSQTAVYIPGDTPTSEFRSDAPLAGLPPPPNEVYFSYDAMTNGNYMTTDLDVWLCPVSGCLRSVEPLSGGSQLSLHIDRQHPGLPEMFQCHLCTFTISLGPLLARHMLLVHPAYVESAGLAISVPSGKAENWKLPTRKRKLPEMSPQIPHSATLGMPPLRPSRSRNDSPMAFDDRSTPSIRRGIQGVAPGVPVAEVARVDYYNAPRFPNTLPFPDVFEDSFPNPYHAQIAGLRLRAAIASNTSSSVPLAPNIDFNSSSTFSMTPDNPIAPHRYAGFLNPGHVERTMEMDYNSAAFGYSSSSSITYPPPSVNEFDNLVPAPPSVAGLLPNEYAEASEEGQGNTLGRRTFSGFLPTEGVFEAGGIDFGYVSFHHGLADTDRNVNPSSARAPGGNYPGMTAFYQGDFASVPSASMNTYAPATERSWPQFRDGEGQRVVQPEVSDTRGVSEEEYHRFWQSRI